MKPPTKPYNFHPACLAFPLLADAELRELADDIKLRGLLQPVVVFRGQILDGRNRLAACEMAGVAPRFTEWPGGGSPVEWVISTNLHRRHLTASQRAVVALDILPLLEKEAKERQRHSQGRGNIPNAKRVADLSSSVRAKVLQSVNGEDVSRFKLLDLITQARTEDRRERIKKARKTGSDQNIIVGDMGILRDRLKDNSVDLFLTDPVYPDVPAYERLAELAGAKLKAGGLCLAYAGQMYLPQVLAAMSEHLRYWWTFAIVYDQLILPIYPRHIKNRWKPVVAFAKPPLRPASDWLLDAVVGAGRDKEYHEWGQQEAEARFFIENLTGPEALVVDCYAGGGAFLAAAKATGRRWLATEQDETTALIGRKRLAEM